MHNTAKLPISIIKELESQQVAAGEGASADAIARIYNPLGDEDFYLFSKSGDVIFCLHRENGKSKIGGVALSDIEKKNLEIDPYFKKKKIGELLSRFNDGVKNLAEGGNVSPVDELKPTNYASYVLAVSQKIIEDMGGEVEVHTLIDSNIGLVNECFKEGLPYQYTAKRLIGKETQTVNFDVLNIYFYNPETNELGNRSEWFDADVDRNLTVLRVKESLTQNHTYEEIAELSFPSPVSIDEHAAKKIMKDLAQKSESDADNNMCLVVFNYEKPTKNFKILLFAKKYLPTKYALQLKTIINTSLKWLGINVMESQIKCSIKQPA